MSSTSAGHAASRRVSRAVILAAGAGDRLRPLSDEVPKCLAEVAGTPILLRTLALLGEVGIENATVVIGHLGQRIVDRVGQNYHGVGVSYVWAPDYDRTNNLVSLWHARDSLNEDILLLEGDVVFERKVLERLLSADADAMAVSQYRDWHSGTVVKLQADGRHVNELVLGSQQSDEFDYTGVFKTVNIHKLSFAFLEEHLVPALCHAVEKGDSQSFYESRFQAPIADGSVRFAAVDVSDLSWYEVDDLKDLEVANLQFTPLDEQLAKIESLHGGYWRYGIRDFSYLYNLYFPPEEMLAQFQSNMRNIVTSYPVAQKELARLLGDWIGAPAENIAVANGASELIKILGRSLASSISIPVPSFNEYENVIDPSNLNRFPLDASTFELDVDRFAESTIAAGSKAAIVVTPNNPTSLSVGVEDLARLAGRLAAHGIALVVDESFIDFSADGTANSVQPLLDEYPNTVLLKSMSKVFGIAGLRLGYVVSSNRDFVDHIRSELPIWNINGFAEEFLRTLGRYRTEFEASCEQIKRDRDEFYEMLLEVPGVEPVKPDANFILLKLLHPGRTGRDVVRWLYEDQRTLVKECSGKSMQSGDLYIRVACRTPSENRALVDSLKRLG